MEQEYAVCAVPQMLRRVRYAGQYFVQILFGPAAQEAVQASP